MTPKIIRFKQIKHHWEIYLLVLPAMAMISLFQYYPAASGVYHSFFRWNGADISEYVGWENYLTLLKTPEFWSSFKIAFILGAWNIVKMIPALAVAVCIHRSRSDWLQYLYRLLFVVPMVIPGLVVALIWRGLFFESTNGLLNRMLYSTGIFNLLCHFDTWFNWGGIFTPAHSPAWLGDPQLILVACIVWGFPWVGSFAVLTHLAKLQGIGKEIYEAAEIDGVSWWSKFTRIELPMLMGSVYLLLVFVIIDTIKDAGMVLALAGMEGGPGGKVTVPALFMIQKAFLYQEMGAACAIGIILTLVVMFLQKLSRVLLEWGEAPWWHRAGWQSVLVLMGMAMLYARVMVPLAVFVLLLALPWGAILPKRRSVPRLAMESAGIDPVINEMLIQEREQHRAARLARASTPHVIARRRMAGFLLTTLRHGFIAFVLAMALLPLYLMMVVSLKANTQFYEAPAVITHPSHWENWTFAWEKVSPNLYNSIFISTSATGLSLLLALGAAYFFARMRMPFSGFLWNAVLVLMMMPTIANLVPLFRLLRDLNLLNTLSALILVGSAGGQVFAIFVLRSFVADIPQELFEAAEVDGASHLQQLFTVVAPLAAPMLGTVGVMNFIGQWNDFVLPLIVMRDEARLPVMVQLFRMNGEYIKYWGPLMAGYTIVSLPVILLFAMSMRLFTRGMTEGAVKG